RAALGPRSRYAARRRKKCLRRGSGGNAVEQRDQRAEHPLEAVGMPLPVLELRIQIGVHPCLSLAPKSVLSLRAASSASQDRCPPADLLPSRDRPAVPPAPRPGRSAPRP